MKTIFYSAILAIIPFLLVIGLSNCKKCPSTNDRETYDLKQGDGKELMGFAGNETLSFIKNKKDTVSFESSGVQEYYTFQTIPSGECEKDYRFANRKALFSNANEGDMIFLYHTNTYDKVFELFFNKQIINPITTAKISASIPLSKLTSVSGKSFTSVLAFGNYTRDSAYINVSTTDNPKYRLLRIKLDTNIYEVIP